MSYEQGKHPAYVKHERTWRDLRAAYHGGDYWYGANDNRYTIGGLTVLQRGAERHGEYLTPELSRLWRHEREKDAKYRRRLRAAVYPNFVKPLVDMMGSTLARAAKKLELPAQIQYLEDDADGRGTDLSAFRRQLIIAALTYGHCYVLIQQPDGPEQPSLYHQLAAGSVPYARLVVPLDLLDWSWDGSAFEWAEVREYRPFTRERGDTDAKEPFCTRVYYRGRWERYEDGVLAEEGTGPKQVPLVPFILNREPTEAEPIGVSPIREVADLAERAFNKSSWLTEQEQNQCFNQAFIASEDPIDAEVERVLGTQTYISGGTDFKWVAPDVAPMQHLMESMRADYQQAKSLLGIETISEQSTEAQSGIALQMSRENLDAVLAGFSAPAEAAERQWLTMATTIAGGSPDALVIEYSHDFTALSAAGRFTMLVTALEKGGYSGKAKAELQKQLFLAAYPDAEQDVVNDVFSDIEESAAQLDLMAPPGMVPPGLEDGQDGGGFGGGDAGPMGKMGMKPGGNGGMSPPNKLPFGKERSA